MPIYCIRTRRPFYTQDLQQTCLDIRKTGIGHNGQPVVFNNMRKDMPEKPQNQSEQRSKVITDTLAQMGLNVTHKKVKTAINNLYPDGLPHSSDEGKVIRDLFRYFSDNYKKDA